MYGFWKFKLNSYNHMRKKNFLAKVNLISESCQGRLGHATWNFKSRHSHRHNTHTYVVTLIVYNTTYSHVYGISMQSLHLSFNSMANSEWMDEWMNQRVKEWVIEWVSERASKSKKYKIGQVFTIFDLSTVCGYSQWVQCVFVVVYVCVRAFVTWCRFFLAYICFHECLCICMAHAVRLSFHLNTTSYYQKYNNKSSAPTHKWIVSLKNSSAPWFGWYFREKFRLLLYFSLLVHLVLLLLHFYSFAVYVSVFIFALGQFHFYWRSHHHPQHHQHQQHHCHSSGSGHEKKITKLKKFAHSSKHRFIFAFTYWAIGLNRGDSAHIVRVYCTLTLL